MADYKKMYLRLFNSVSDAIEHIDIASEILKKAQQDCEEIYIDSSPYYENSDEKIVKMKFDTNI